MAVVVMLAHQDTRLARCVIPAPTAATNTTTGRAAFNLRLTNVIDTPLYFLEMLLESGKALQ